MRPDGSGAGTRIDTTFRIGGPPEAVSTFSSAADYMDARSFLGAHRVVGGGSNLVISDEGPAGTVAVLSSGASGVIDVDGPRVLLDAAGNWHETALDLADRDLAGVESLVGIPGTVGGAIVQNIGAYGHEICEVVERVEVVSGDDGSSTWLTGEQCGFGYRDSIFKSLERGRHIVLAAELRLRPGGRHEPVYEELSRELARRTTGHPRGSYELHDVHDAVLALRSKKNMVWDSDDPRTWGAGSFFVNPTVTAGVLEELTARVGDAPPSWKVATAPHEAAPHEAAGHDGAGHDGAGHDGAGHDGDVRGDGPKGIDDGLHKVSAGWLVERAGYVRGHRWRTVGLTEGHALGLVNITGRATSADVLEAANEIARGVSRLCGLRLLAEPILLGFDPGLHLDFDAHIEP